MNPQNPLIPAERALVRWYAKDPSSLEVVDYLDDNERIATEDFDYSAGACYREWRAAASEGPRAAMAEIERLVRRLTEDYGFPPQVVEQALAVISEVQYTLKRQLLRGQAENWRRNVPGKTLGPIWVNDLAPAMIHARGAIIFTVAGTFQLGKADLLTMIDGTVECGQQAVPDYAKSQSAYQTLDLHDLHVDEMPPIDVTDDDMSR